METDPRKAERKRKNQIPFRLNILFIIVFLLFSSLILRLGVVQIVQGEKYIEEVQESQNKTAKLDSARGLIYDRNGRLLVGNHPETAVTYTRTKKMGNTLEERLKLAEKLAKYIQKDTSKVTERDKKDYWILKKGWDQVSKSKLTKAEQGRYKDQQDKAYKLVLDRVTDKDLKQITKKEMNVIGIWHELNQAMVLTPQYVAEGLTTKETAEIGEHLDSLPGIGLTTVSDRTYPEGYQFYFGNVKPIPKEKLDYYLSRNYDRNDWVGTGYLEQYYEDVLNGTKTKLNFLIDKSGDPIEDPTKIEGRRGDDMVLTVDIKLEKKIQDILKNEVRDAMTNYDNPYLNSAYAVVVNSNTGGILSLNGVEYRNGRFHDVSYKTVTGSFAIGSNIKGATVLAGFQTGTIPGYFDDKIMIFKNGEDLHSYQGNHIGVINAVQALEASSNIYMAKIAANMAGFRVENEGDHYRVYVQKDQKYLDAFYNLRDIYSEFGLGIKTQIDLPSEGIGYQGDIQSVEPGQILRFSFGQFDTYTPIEVAQYFSTIANGGKRMQLHFLKSIHEPSEDLGSPGKTVYQFKPNILNQLTMSKEAIDKVRNGFKLVTHGERVFNHTPTAWQLGMEPCTPYKIAGKTGTADVTIDGKETVNELFSGYAPYDDPEVAVVVVVPGDDIGKQHIKIAGQIFQTYFQMKNEELGNMAQCPNPNLPY